jgi:hypothetical protein
MIQTSDRCGGKAIGAKKVYINTEAQTGMELFVMRIKVFTISIDMNSNQCLNMPQEYGICLNNFFVSSFTPFLPRASLLMLGNLLSEFVMNRARPPGLDIGIEHHINVL